MKFPMVLLLFCAATFVLNGQNVSEYSGSIELNGEGYFSSFHYFMDQGDTVYHGDFLISRPMVGHDIEEPFVFLTIKGHFDNNRADDRWNLRTGEFTAHENRSYEGYRYMVNVKGTELAATANFNDGTKSGAWSLYEWKVDDSSVTDTLIGVSVHFNSDSISGPFEFRDVSRMLQGQVDTEGFATGVWRFYTLDEGISQTLRESWKFEDKQLVEIEHFRGSDSYGFSLRGDTAEGGEFEAIKLGKDYLEVVSILSKAVDPDAHHNFTERPDVGAFYMEIREKVKDADERLFSKVELDFPLSVKALLYNVPLSRKERRLLNNLAKISENLHGLLEKITENPQINIARISNPEVIRYFGILMVIESTYLTPLERMLGLFENGALVYTDRNKYVTDVFDFSNELSGKAEKKDTSFTVEYTFSDIVPDADEEPLAGLEIFMEGLEDEIEAINDTLKYFIFEVRQAKELTDQEAELYELYEFLMQLSDSLLEEEHARVAGFDLNAVISDFLKGQIRDYAKIETPNERSESLLKLMSCFDQAEELIQTLAGTPEKYYATRDGYKRQVFNPYTYTYMEETMKSSIFKAFDKVLLPGLFENMQSLDCINIADFRKNFEIVFDDMVEIREKDTRRQERKVKRVSDPAKVSEILEFDLKFN